MSEKPVVTSAVRINAYKVVADAVERGCMRGMHRAYKHTDEPSRAMIAEACEAEVMNELSEILNFGDEE